MRNIILFFALLTFASCQNQGNYYFTLNNLNDTYELFSYVEKQSMPMVSAHRGGPYPGFPENCLETFEYNTQFGPTIIECDIATTKDDSLVLMHDNTLDRTTNGQGELGSKTYEEISKLYLVDNDGMKTNFKIPTYYQTLKWAKDKVFLTLDLKKGLSFEKVIDKVREMNMAPYCAIITYNVDDAQTVHKYAPELMISVTIIDKSDYFELKQAGIPDDRMIAFTGLSAQKPEFYSFLHEKGIRCMMATFGEIDKKAADGATTIYSELIDKGVDIIATDNPAEALIELRSKWESYSEFNKFVKFQ
ncbi:glycerophosphodiester phosphodiesterase family protein [Aureibacter tunicatorum]|uniref:Glycerophosphoryl diester phosphodiesterase n=1 Tax=Aureibacter tunicatorum TaxID=866807 RepID=A0AAE3XLU5_9BACT|nr:glycerophosphodiester phosphodiesterase family protein [Aureibacter tunicatorum]MDR6238349.1 glycerophosphoryl diester phosphodiesterase [Aureibacter tunicatorum]BDD03381.1 glycerophosphoryl diester phosphodiesterase [Aureibacter tunicatorum]